MKTLFVSAILLSAICKAQVVTCNGKTEGSGNPIQFLAQASHGIGPLKLDSGNKLLVDFFSDEIRISELRPPNQAEKDKAEKMGVGIEGVNIASLKISEQFFNTQIDFETDDLQLTCKVTAN